jgi:hypothetical protein
MAIGAAAFSKAPEPGLLGGVVPVTFRRNSMLTNYSARPHRPIMLLGRADEVIE